MIQTDNNYNNSNLNNGNIPSFSLLRRVVKHKLCLRECAKIVNIAANTGCRITIIKGNQKGTSEGILSLVQLGIKKNDYILFTIEGANQLEAFHQLTELFDYGING